MPPDARRATTTREELARVAAQQEAAKEATGRMAVDLHRLLEGMREDVREVGEKMATAEQVRRLEDRLTEVDRRVTEHAPAVGAVPELKAKVEALEKTAVRAETQEKLVARVDALEKASTAHGAAVESLPVIRERQDAQEHRASRLAGGLWVVGAIVTLLGLAGLRDCGRWFVQAQAPAQHLPAIQEAPESAPPTRRR